MKKKRKIVGEKAEAKKKNKNKNKKELKTQEELQLPCSRGLTKLSAAKPATTASAETPKVSQTCRGVHRPQKGVLKTRRATEQPG